MAEIGHIKVDGLDAQDGTGDSICLGHTQQIVCFLDLHTLSGD